MSGCNSIVFCFLGIIIAFNFFLNLNETLVIIKDIKKAKDEYEGALFDCNYYSLIIFLIITSYATLISFLCVLSSFFFISFVSEYLSWKIITTLIYIIFGPLMSTICFLILLNYENFGYTCDQDLNKIYNPSIWVIVSLLCIIGLTFTVIRCKKTVISKIGSIASSMWAKKLVNCLLREPDQLIDLERQCNLERIERSRREQVRA